MTVIVIGAPVHQRGWVLRQWFDALASQEEFPAQELLVVLNYGHSDDDTLEIITNEHRFAEVLAIESRGVEHQAERSWGPERYTVMARLRNDLLAVVRDYRPEHYLSCDTDMLLPAHALRTLVPTLGQYDGVAPLAFMTPHGTTCPNAMGRNTLRPMVPSYGLYGTYPAYAVFGVVLMSPALYAVDYSVHHLGEDLGWAANVAAAGLRLGLCGDVRVKHVMTRDRLDEIDERVGF